MTIRDEKYLVFRRDEMDQWVTDTLAGLSPGEPPKEIQDAVVVRRQDIFAPAVLFGYASQVLGVTDIIGELVVEIEEKETARELHEMRQELLKVWDYFNTQGQEAMAQRRKLPD